MVCECQIFEEPVLTDPVLIGGLPGIGFVANIASLHLIRQLKAQLFAEIRSSFFQDIAVTSGNGKANFPANKLYYHKGRAGERDLIILSGNTQALTTNGQYELCGHILDLTTQLGCKYIITLGGLLREKNIETPELRCAGSDKETLRDAMKLGAKKMQGRIFGVAGLLVGLGELRGVRGFCLLVETQGAFPDATAARSALQAVRKFCNLKLELSSITKAAEAVSDTMKSFGVISPSMGEGKRKTEYGWLI